MSWLAVSLGLGAMLVACARSRDATSASPGLAAGAQDELGDEAALAELEARLGELRGELTRSARGSLALAEGADASVVTRETAARRSGEAELREARANQEEEDDDVKDRGATSVRGRKDKRRDAPHDAIGGAAEPGAGAPSRDAAARVQESKVAASPPAPAPSTTDAVASEADAAQAPAKASHESFDDEGDATCPKVCSLSEAICELTDRVCQLASRHVGEAPFEVACARAKTDCTDAVAACSACTLDG